MDLNWKRVLTKSEEILEYIHREKQMLICYALTLSSVKELRQNNFESALINLQRKVPTLRLRITKRQDDLWFTERTDDIIDFEVRKDDTSDNLIKEVITHTYKSDVNPLWIARLLVNNLPITEGESKYQLFLGFHHSISDGYSNIYTAQLFLQLINNELDGKTETQHQLGIHATDTQSKKIVKIVEAQVAKQIDKGLSMAEILNVKSVQIAELFKAPKYGENGTNTITTTFSREETSKFISLCKLHNVSFHSAFSTIINVTIASMLVDVRMDCKTYEIPSLHAINLRRYWQPNSEIHLGPHARTMPITAAIAKCDVSNIWQCAMAFHKQFTNLIESKTVFRFNAYCDVTNTSKSKAFPFYYVTSNMGCVDSSLGLQFRHVNVAAIERHVSCSKSQAVIHQLHTLNGQYVHSIDYNVQLVTKEAACSYSNMICDSFKQSLLQ